jgi:outer membrane protein assembly factor BamB
MKRRILLVLVAASLLAGCSVTEEIGSWFSSSGKKSTLRGVRIPVMSLDESLKPDPTIATMPVVLPAPYRNTEWPQPGGYAGNAMYHLSAPGRLREVWRESAGKGSDISPPRR